MPRGQLYRSKRQALPLASSTSSIDVGDCSERSYGVRGWEVGGEGDYFPLLFERDTGTRKGFLKTSILTSLRNRDHASIFVLQEQCFRPRSRSFSKKKRVTRGYKMERSKLVKRQRKKKNKGKKAGKKKVQSIDVVRKEWLTKVHSHK